MNFFMRFVFFGLCFQVLPLFASVKAQQVTLSLKNATFRQLVKALESQTDMTFLFQVEQTAHLKKLDLEVENKPWQEVLNDCLEGSGLTYQLVENTVVISPAFSKKEVKSVEKQIVKGIVKYKSGMTLPGVTVLIKGTDLGCITDESGKYELMLPDATDVILVFSFVGMQTQEVAYTGQGTLNIVMEMSNTEMEEVVVNGIFERKAESFTGSATVINREKLLNGGNKNLLQNLRNIDPSFKIVESLDYGSDPNRMPEIQMR